jgi:Mlc titration factor MtfA (ptsG expression regulator)
MAETLVVLLMSGLIIGWILLSPRLLQWRRDCLKQRPLSPAWKQVVTSYLPIYCHLSPAQRQQLEGHIQVFLAEKQFIGCAGLLVTEEMKLTIAAIACLLLLNGRGKYFPQLRSILIYPGPYLVQETVAIGGDVMSERQVVRLGESWTRDQLILAWDQIQRDAFNWGDGHNVVLHEFAHQLDQEDGRAEGVPILPRRADYPIWTQVMTAAYHQLCWEVEQGARTTIDRYGVTNPAEFFAVATETFFEKPHQLLKHYPALYEQLRRYYTKNG